MRNEKLKMAPNIAESVQKIEYIFRLTGLNIGIKPKNKFEKYRVLFIFFLNLIWLNLNAVSVSCCLINGLIQHPDFIDFMYLAPYINLNTLAVIKVISMFINKKKVELLIEKIRILEIKHINRMENVEIEKVVSTENKFLMLLINLLTSIYGFVLFCFTTSPIILIILNYLKTNELELILPIVTSYPFNPYDYRIYPFLYFYQFWTMCLLCLYLTSADLIFCIFCTHLCTQFRILAYYAENLVPDDYNHKTFNNQYHIKLELVELIKWHQELLSCAQVLESVYTVSTLCNFTLSSILICVGGFNVVATETIFSKFLTILLMSLVQVFIPCLFGDLLKESSLAVSDGIYNSRWYLIDVSIAKSLLLVLTKSQSPCILTAWGYADVNLRAFIKIGSTAWSYFALLQTLYSVENQEE